MKKWIGISAACLLFGLGACNEDESTGEKYEAWRKSNLAYFDAKSEEVDPATGEKVYEKLVPDWNANVYVLRKMYKRGDGRRPYANSRVAMRYKGVLMNGTPFDSSYLATDSLFVNRVDSLIDGFGIALQYMVEGDSCELIVPASLGYSSQGKYNSSGYLTIPPYSALVFGLELAKIVDWERP